MRRAIPAALAAVALVGCGNEKSEPPDVETPANPVARTVTASFPSEGLRFAMPQNYKRVNGRAPLVVSVVSGSAAIAVWRYPREEPLPEDKDALREARRQLVASVKRRDRAIKLNANRLVKQRGDDAILLTGTQDIAGRARRFRSLHVFAHKGEVVVDAYALPADFPRLDTAVFQPLIRSLRISEPKQAKKSS